MYRRLFIWVEGDDDENFVTGILKPVFVKVYDGISIIQYAQESYDYVSRFLSSIKQMDAVYIFTGDINSSNCSKEKKEKLIGKYDNLDSGNIAIVIKEIESWFLAGLNKVKSECLGLKNLPHTNDITKENFDNLIKDRFDSRIDAMAEILSHFSIDTAKIKNNSFRYFADKYNIN